MDSLINDQLKNDFLLSFTRNSAFSNLPIPLQAQISKYSLCFENRSKIDCCKFCGIKLNLETSKIQIIKRKRKQKSSKLFIICQGCRRFASSPIRLPSTILIDDKDERTSSKTSKFLKISKSTQNFVEGNARRTMMNVSHCQSGKGVMRQNLKVNKLHQLAMKNSKPICTSLSSFLKSFH